MTCAGHISLNHLLDLFTFLTADMTTLEFNDLSKEELILKFGT